MPSLKSAVACFVLGQPYGVFTGGTRRYILPKYPGFGTICIDANSNRTHYYPSRLWRVDHDRAAYPGGHCRGRRHQHRPNRLADPVDLRPPQLAPLSFYKRRLPPSSDIRFGLHNVGLVPPLIHMRRRTPAPIGSREAPIAMGTVTEHVAATLSRKKRPPALPQAAQV